MSDENSTEDQEIISKDVKESPVESEHDSSSVSGADVFSNGEQYIIPPEERATAKGWSADKEAFEQNNPGKEWVTAEEFNRREELIGQIQEARRETRAAETLARAALKEATRLRQRDKEEKLRQLEAAKMEAVELGDVEEYRRVEESESKLKKEDAEAIDAFSEDEKQMVSEFMSKPSNKWTQGKTPEDSRMVDAFDKMYLWSKAEHPNKSIAEHMAFAEKQLQAFYPHRFSNINRQSAPSVTSGTKSALGSGSAANNAYHKLSDFEKRCCDKFVSIGGSRDEYIGMLQKNKR